jgi:hypothetical protein
MILGDKPLISEVVLSQDASLSALLCLIVTHAVIGGYLTPFFLNTKCARYDLKKKMMTVG